MSRYTVLLGLLVVMIAVYGEDKEVCCGANETWNMCGRLCEPKCNDTKPDPRLCPKIACSNSTAACRCDDGYVRDTTNGTCVVPAECQNNEA